VCIFLLFSKYFWTNAFISLFNTQRVHICKIYGKQQHFYAFRKKPYALPGFEPRSSDTEADALFTAPHRQADIVLIVLPTKSTRNKVPLWQVQLRVECEEASKDFSWTKTCGRIGFMESEAPKKTFVHKCPTYFTSRPLPTITRFCAAWGQFLYIKNTMRKLG
jgi:hypothetical protein